MAPDEPRPTTQIAWRPLAVVAGTVLLVLVALSTRYGYHRDELYFLACGKRLAWGYPDQPPLTPFLAWLMDAVGHGSLVVFRFPAALAAAGMALMTGLCAREFGGGRFAQTLAAGTVAASTIVLLSGHLLVTSTVDLLVWVTLTWLVLVLLRGADQRLWLVVGVVAGLGFLNKELPVVLLAGLFVGVLLTPAARPVLRTPWPWIGAGIASLMWAPVLIWQAQHGWPQFDLASQIRDEYGAAGERTAFLVLQLVIFSLGATYLWIRGLAGLWRREEWRSLRVFAWAWLFVFGFFVITAGQAYYPAGTYPVLIAAGAVVVEQGRRRGLVVGVVAVSSVLLIPAALPVLPAETFGDSFYADIADPVLDTVGWQAFVDQVAEAYATIPEDQRADAQIYATNYGEAGAIDRFGRSLGLPPAWSGLNGYGLWGPPPESTAPVVVVWEGDGPPRAFDDCRDVAKVDTGVPNEETLYASIYVCSGPSGGWAQAWPQLEHLSN